MLSLVKKYAVLLGIEGFFTERVGFVRRFYKILE